MSIAIESEEVQLQKLLERLRQMSDDELIKFGKDVRKLSARRVSVTPDPCRSTPISSRLTRKDCNGRVEYCLFSAHGLEYGVLLC